MTADIQFVYLRREGFNYRVSVRMTDMTFAGRPGDIIWWFQGDGNVVFEFVHIRDMPEPQWIECVDGEARYKSGLYDNGLPAYGPLT